jgi:hypothetical protein
MSKIDGMLAGAVGGALATIGLLKIKPPPAPITSNKQIIRPQSLAAGATGMTILPSTTYKFAIILFHGDGDAQIKLTVTVNGTSVTLYGNEQAIELLANQTISVVADNTDTTAARSTPTIEILSLSW